MRFAIWISSTNKLNFVKNSFNLSLTNKLSIFALHDRNSYQIDGQLDAGF